MTEPLPPAPPTEVLPAPEVPADAAPQPKPCGKAFASLLLGLFGCLLGGVAVAGLVWSPGAGDNVQLTGNLNQMQDVIVADTKERGLKMFFASFGQWFGFIGAGLGLIGILQGITHLYQAGIRLVIPRRWLAGFGTLFSFIACLSIVAGLKHGYAANVGLHVENANEAFDRVGQVANVMQQAQDIAEGKAPAPAGLDEQTRGMAESLFAGTLNPITQIWTEDYLNRHAPNIEFYATDGRSYSIEKSRNTRVIVMLMRASSPGCQQSVAILNQLYDETSRGDLRILAVSQETPASLDAFVRRTGAKFPVGKAAVLPSEPYGDVQSFPTYFILDPDGVIKKILIGPQSLNTLRSAITAN